MSNSKEIKREVKGEERSYGKIKATFECQTSGCKNIWTSVHGWAGYQKTTNCKSCDKRANLVDVAEGHNWFDQFNCECGNTWASIYKGDFDTDTKLGIVKNSQENCSSCNSLVICAGTQNRFACRYWFRCENQNCPIESLWDNFTFNPTTRQRCSECGNVGTIVEAKKPRERKREYPNQRIRESGPHMEEFCDMCSRLQKEGRKMTNGRPMTCLRWKEIQCSAEKQEDGTDVEKVKKAIPVAIGYELTYY